MREIDILPWLAGCAFVFAQTGNLYSSLPHLHNCELTSITCVTFAITDVVTNTNIIRSYWTLPHLSNLQSRILISNYV